MRVDIPGALRDLTRLTERLAELIEWERLVQREHRPDLPPSFQLRNHIPKEMSSLHQSFLVLAEDLRQILEDPHLRSTRQDRARWKAKLEAECRRVRNMGLAERFLFP